MEPKIIKGCPGGPNGKWEEVQAFQHKPFIYIHYNGSKWAGEEADDVQELLYMLAKYKLDFERFGDFISANPCCGVRNYAEGANEEPFIDGPRLYACDGVVRFAGNFEEYSHAFCVETNHKPTIEALTAAIERNATL